MPTRLDSAINRTCEKWQQECGNYSVTMPESDKIVQDPIHGVIKIEKELVLILDSVMMQRLRRISQLGLTNQVFPGANHTRFEHSLGVMHLAGLILDRIRKNEGLLEDQIMEAKAAALLHDIGHLPFSHVLEPLLEVHQEIKKESQEKNLKPSELLTMKMIQSEWMKEIFEILNKKSGRFNLEVENVSRLAVGIPPRDHPKSIFLGEINHGNFDADRMDYLMRDAHYTGVPLGTLDVERLVRVATTTTSYGANKHLAVDVKGLHSLVSMIVARSVMYSVVYFHHAVRAVNGMLLRAVYSAYRKDPLQLLNFDDYSLLSHLNGISEARSLIDKVRSRVLFKSAIMLRTRDALNESALMGFVLGETIDSIVGHEEKIDKMVADDNERHCILDLPKTEIYSEIDFDIKETVDGRERVSPVRNHSRIVKGVEDDPMLKWRGYVFGPQRELSKVKKVALDYLESQGVRFGVS